MYIVFGIIAGFIANQIVGGGGGLVLNLIVGIVGSFLGGWLFSQFGMPVAKGINLPSLLVSVIGGIVLLLIVNFIRRR